MTHDSYYETASANAGELYLLIVYAYQLHNMQQWMMQLDGMESRKYLALCLNILCTMDYVLKF